MRWQSTKRGALSHPPFSTNCHHTLMCYLCLATTSMYYELCVCLDTVSSKGFSFTPAAIGGDASFNRAHFLYSQKRPCFPRRTFLAQSDCTKRGHYRFEDLVVSFSTVHLDSVKLRHNKVTIALPKRDNFSYRSNSTDFANIVDLKSSNLYTQ